MTHNTPDSPLVAHTGPRGGGRPLRWLALLAGLVCLAMLSGPASAQAHHELRVTKNVDRSDSMLLEGATLNGNVYITASPDTGASKVEFWLDDPTMSGPPRTVEGKAPWDFAGTASDGKPNAFSTTTIANGSHTVTARVTHSKTNITTIHATFVVDNETTPPPPEEGVELAFSTESDRSPATQLEGATLSGKVYIFYPTRSGITEVRFYLDDPAMSRTPYRTETGAPYDLAGGTATEANPLNTKEYADGQHTLTAAVVRNGLTETYVSTFQIHNPTTCSPVLCENVLVTPPYELDFSEDRGGVLDKNGIGTGFTWLDAPKKGTGYIPANLAIDQATGKLYYTTTNGLNTGTANTQDNALGVGIDAPNHISVLSTSIISPPPGTGKNEQVGLWLGNDDDNYVKLYVISTTEGIYVNIQYEMEVGGGRSGSKFVKASLDLTQANVRLSLRADPNDRTIKGFYSVNGGPTTLLGTHTAPPEFFSFDAAGIDPTIGTRTFGGIYASHRFGGQAQTFAFDDFSLTEHIPVSTVPPSAIEFNRAPIPVPNPTSIAYGPDGKLYVSEMLGKIHRITLGPDGEVISNEVFNPLGSRLTLGLTIDPRSTAEDVAIWVAHSSPSLDNGEPNSGIVSRVSGANLGTREDVLTGIPRAKANHATNSIHFGPDGKLYLAQGGNTGAGAPNTSTTEFGTMEEQPLSAALLVADVFANGFDGSCHNETNIFGPPPCDVQPYATGLRNMYDFIFHSNGQIYGPDNGLGVAGSFPPSPTPPCFGFGSTTSWTQGGNNPGEQPDTLKRIVQGKYYGHPNPYRDECVFADGTYQGVAPLASWAPPLHDLGPHRSANGTVEYRAGTFCGDLREQILIANYSLGDNITRTKLAADGLSVLEHKELTGGFKDPLPLAAAPDGRLFVGEMGLGQVTVLTPINKGCWTPKAPVGEHILDAGGTALGGKVYVVGGKTTAGPRSTVNVYDPATDSWSTAAPLPGAAVENPALVALNGKLYAFGGSTSPFSGAVTNAAVYDPAANAWTALPPMQTARGGAFAQAIGSKIYVGGGLGGDGASLASVEVFDPASGTWTSAAPMAERRDNPGAGVHDGKLFVFGGRTRNADGTTVNGTLSSTEMYDPATNSWTAKAPMPTGRRTFAVGYIDGRFQAMGGEVAPGNVAFPQNEEYDPVTDTWRALRDMRTPRHGAAAGTIDGTVYVVGGGTLSGSSFSAANDAFSFLGPE